MKYITFEKNENTAVLLSKYQFETVSSFWIYNVFGIDDKAKLSPELKELCIEIPSEIALGSIFAGYDFSQVKSTNIKGENPNIKYFRSALGLSDTEILLPRDKFKYTFTETDHKNATAYIKLILLHYINNYYKILDVVLQRRYKAKIDSIKTKIELCATNADCFIIMHHHFNYALTILNLELKQGKSVEGAQWNLTIPGGERIKYATDPEVDPGPNINNIDSTVFGITWTIGEAVLVQE